MNGLWLAFLLLSLVWAFTAVVPSWPFELFSWQFRSPDKMRPSARRLGVFRAHSSIVAVFFFAVFLFAVLPGTEVDRGTVAIVVMIVGFVGIGVVIGVLSFSKSHEARRAREAASVPPNEPSEEGYSLLYFSVIFTAVGLLIPALIIYTSYTREAAANAPLSPEEQAQVDEHVAEVQEVIEDYYDSLVPTRDIIQPTPPVVAGPTAPGEQLAAPLEALAVDPAERAPARLWDEGEGPDETVSPDELLAAADLAVALPDRLCTVTGVIVTETVDAVTVDLVVVPDAAASADGCGDPDVPLRTWYPIDLATPLEGREVRTGSGELVPAS